MPDIIELIDNAIDDALSADAMRWTTDPPASPAYEVGNWSRAHGVELTGWQTVVLRHYLDPSVMFPGLSEDEAVERLRTALGES